MHLFSKEHLAASSGIVGAAGPAAAGFALAAQYLRPGAIAVAFFGEGAINQGMMMEAMNLAVVWQLPVLFVCKDDDWSITAASQRWTGGGLRDRARGLGVDYLAVDGLDVAAVWEAARRAIEGIREGGGPVFLHVSCVHLEAHFLGYQLLRATRDPLREMPRIGGPLLRSFVSSGGGTLGQRLAGLRRVLAVTAATLRDPRRSVANDPVLRARRLLMGDPDRLAALDDDLEREVAGVVVAALKEGTG